MSNARFGLRVRNGLVRPITEGFSAYDADALAFINAAGITNSTQIGAINVLVIDLKSFGLWTKMRAIYPFVGGTASAHKFNLKNPQDTNEAFRLVFNGGWTHSATGALPNGTNAFANTFLIPSTNLPNFDAHLSYYSRSNLAPGTLRCSIGSYNASFTSAHQIIIRANTNDTFFGVINAGVSANVLNINTQGHYIASRTASNVLNIHKNGILLATNNALITSIPNDQPLYIAARRDGLGITGYDNKETAFASIGDGLTDTEAANLYTTVQAFQTTLGRQV